MKIKIRHLHIPSIDFQAVSINVRVIHIIAGLAFMHIFAQYTHLDNPMRIFKNRRVNSNFQISLTIDINASNEHKLFPTHRLWKQMKCAQLLPPSVIFINMRMRNWNIDYASVIMRARLSTMFLSNFSDYIVNKWNVHHRNLLLYATLCSYHNELNVNFKCFQYLMVIKEN